MAGQPLSAAELEKVKNYLLNGAAKSNTGSVIPYSPEYIDKLAAMSKAPVKSKPKASKGLLAAKEAPMPTGLLTSPESEFTQDSAAPVTQEFLSAANKGVAAAPSAVATVPNDPNIAASWAKPKISKEVVTTTKPDGTKIEKAKHTEEAPKSPKTNTMANGDLIPADAIPKTNHNMPPVDVSGGTVGPSISQDPAPQLIPGTMNYEAPNVNRFDPTAPPVPIVAQYPMAMPPIQPERLTDTTGMIPAENTASQGLDTKISALAPLPEADMKAFEDLRNQRLLQIADAEQSGRDFMGSYEPRTDLSALLSFIGSQLGRDYLTGYQKPGGLKELVGIQDKLEENLAKARTGLSDTQLQFLKARMGLQDTQKSEERILSKLINPDVLKMKASSSANQDLNQFNKRGAVVEARFREYDDQSSQNPGAGAKLDAFKKILESSVGIDKIITRNKGQYPAPNSTDYDTINTLISDQLVLVNRYKALLGALQGADERIVRSGMGVDESSMPNWVRSLSPQKRLGIAQAQSSFQQSIIDDINSIDASVTKKYENGGEYMKTPELMEYHRAKKAEADYIIKELLMNKPGVLTPKQQESLFKVLTPEQREAIRQDAKKRLGGK